MKNNYKIVLMLEDPMLEQPIKDSRIKTSAQIQAQLNTWITLDFLIKVEETPLPNGLIRHRILRRKEQGEA
jgi:hypothetical protein